MRRKQQDHPQQAKEQDLRRNQNCQQLDLGLLASRTEKNKFVLFKPPRLWYFVMVALENEYKLVELEVFEGCFASIHKCRFRAQERGLVWKQIYGSWGQIQGG